MLGIAGEGIVLTKEQISIAGNQLVAEATVKRDREVLKRLESRFGPKPPGMDVGQFKERTVAAQFWLLRSWQFWSLIAGYAAVLAVPIYFHIQPAVIAAIPFCALVVRLVSRWLTTKFIRDGVKGDA
jgi:hypothetical protein